MLVVLGKTDVILNLKMTLFDNEKGRYLTMEKDDTIFGNDVAIML